MAVVTAALLFLPAGDPYYWQAWLLLACYFMPTVAVTHWLIRSNPDLLVRRLKAGVGAEQRRTQKFIIGAASIAFAALLILPAVEYRCGREPLTSLAVATGDFLVILGIMVIAAVYRANPYSSARIRVEKSQPLITKGPYAIVRHPMYAGMCVHLLGVPLALGYVRAYIPAAVLFVLLVVRLLDEERQLMVELPGYVDYMSQVRHRLVPMLW